MLVISAVHEVPGTHENRVVLIHQFSSLNNAFVPAVINTTGKPATGASFKHAPSDQAGLCTTGIGHQNVQCLFLTPEGEIFHAITGHQGPQALADEMDYAAKLFTRMKVQPEETRELVVQRHRARLTAMGVPENRGFDMMRILDGAFRLRNDAQFCVDHPLMSWLELERRPQLLVATGPFSSASEQFVIKVTAGWIAKKD